MRANSLRAKVRDVCLPKLNAKITLSIDAMCLPYKYYSSLRSHISFHVKPSPNIKQLSSAKCLSGLNAIQYLKLQSCQTIIDQAVSRSQISFKTSRRFRRSMMIFPFTKSFRNASQKHPIPARLRSLLC